MNADLKKSIDDLRLLERMKGVNHPEVLVRRAELESLHKTWSDAAREAAGSARHQGMTERIASKGRALEGSGHNIYYDHDNHHDDRVHTAWSEAADPAERAADEHHIEKVLGGAAHDEKGKAGFMSHGWNKDEEGNRTYEVRHDEGAE